MVKVMSPFDADGPWSIIAPSQRTLVAQSTAFAMMSRAACCVHATICHAHQLYPFKIFGLLLDPSLASVIKSDLACMLDSFSLCFRQTFPTEAAMRSVECMHVLRSIALIMRIDTVRIECRHASIRRGKLVASQTHSQSVEHAHFVMACQRIIEGCSAAGGSHQQDCVPPSSSPAAEVPVQAKRPRGRPRKDRNFKMVKKKGVAPRKSFVGTWQVWLSKQHRGTSSVSMKVSRVLYHEIKLAGGFAWQKLVTKARLANAANQLGAPAFGERAKARKKAPPPGPSLATAIRDLELLYEPAAEGDNIENGLMVRLSEVHREHMRDLRRESRARHAAAEKEKSERLSAIGQWTAAENQREAFNVPDGGLNVQPEGSGPGFVFNSWAAPATRGPVGVRWACPSGFGKNVSGIMAEGTHDASCSLFARPRQACQHNDSVWQGRLLCMQPTLREAQCLCEGVEGCDADCTQEGCPDS